MGIRLSEIVARTRPVVAKFGGLEIHVVYRMSERTMNASEAEEDVDHPWLVRVIESWDIDGDDGKPIPIDLASVKNVPIPVLNSIIAAIYSDDGEAVGEAVSSSDAG
ncbi:MAG: hypothetical protein ABIP21_00270 [Acidimicrobiia bacterium]